MRFNIRYTTLLVATALLLVASSTLYLSSLPF